MGTVSQACLNMKAFVIVALVAAVSGEADPYTIGQVLAGQTNGGVLTSTTYHGGVKVAGFPYTKVAAVPAVSYAAAYPPISNKKSIFRSIRIRGIRCSMGIHHICIHRCRENICNRHIRNGVRKRMGGIRSMHTRLVDRLQLRAQLQLLAS